MYSGEPTAHQQRRTPSGPGASGASAVGTPASCRQPRGRDVRLRAAGKCGRVPVGEYDPQRGDPALMAEQSTQDAGGVLDPQRALAFLARASAVLARSLDYERTLAEVAQLAVPEFSDWCAVDVVQDDGSLRQITSGHPDPRMEELLMELRRRYRRDKGASEGAMHVIATGESELVTDVRDSPRVDIGSE